MYLVTSLGTFDNLSEFMDAMQQKQKRRPCIHCGLTRYIEASGFCRFCEIDLWDKWTVNVK